MSQGPLGATIGQLLGSTSQVFAQYGKQRELWTGQRHGKYYAGAYSGRGGFIANQAVVTLVALAATTYTGLAIQNPTGSGVNLSIQKVYATQSVIAAAMQTIALMYGHTTFTPADSLTPYSTILGGSAAALKANVTASATLDGSAVLLAPLAATQIAAGSYSVREDIDGAIILPPGYYMGICDPTGTPTSSAVWASILWEEIAV